MNRCSPTCHIHFIHAKLAVTTDHLTEVAVATGFKKVYLEFSWNLETFHVHLNHKFLWQLQWFMQTSQGITIYDSNVYHSCNKCKQTTAQSLAKSKVNIRSEQNICWLRNRNWQLCSALKSEMKWNLIQVCKPVKWCAVSSLGWLHL